MKTKGSGFPIYNKYSNDRKTFPFYKVKRDFKSPMRKMGWNWRKKEHNKAILYRVFGRMPVSANSM